MMTVSVMFAPLPAEALVRIDGTGGLVRLVLAVLALGVGAAALRRAAHLGNGRDELVALARAGLQLGTVGLIIAVVLQHWGLTWAFVAVMLGVATITAGRRMSAERPALTFPAVAAAPVPITLGLMAIGLLPAAPIAVIPTAGILIGNAMTATALAGRRGLDSLTERRGEYEAALALGLPPRDATLLVVRDAARIALIPGLDQTRTAGLVTLPGAFVGTLLGGATPLEAAALQLIVSAGIMATQSVSVVLTVEGVARGQLRRTTA